jgi:hypothetical protein
MMPVRTDEKVRQSLFPQVTLTNCAWLEFIPPTRTPQKGQLRCHVQIACNTLKRLE